MRLKVAGGFVSATNHLNNCHGLQHGQIYQESKNSVLIQRCKKVVSNQGVEFKHK
jgi:hypothetical protein